MTPELEAVIAEANELHAQIKELQEKQDVLLKKVTAAAYAEDATVESIQELWDRTHDHVTRCFLHDAQTQAAIRQNGGKVEVKR